MNKYTMLLLRTETRAYRFECDAENEQTARVAAWEYMNTQDDESEINWEDCKIIDAEEFIDDLEIVS